MRAYFAYLIIAGMLLLPASLSWAGDDLVRYARSLQAKDYDQSLPAELIGQWLQKILPKGTTVVWGDFITDCGEQTGDPAIDKERDIPLCAEVELKQKGKTIGSLMFFIGTERKGKVKEPALYFGNYRQGSKTVWIQKLSELTRLQQQ